MLASPDEASDPCGGWSTEVRCTRHPSPDPVSLLTRTNDNETNPAAATHRLALTNDQVLASTLPPVSKEFVPHAPHHAVICIRCTRARVTVGRAAHITGVECAWWIHFYLLFGEILYIPPSRAGRRAIGQHQHHAHPLPLSLDTAPGRAGVLPVVGVVVVWGWGGIYQGCRG